MIGVSDLPFGPTVFRVDAYRTETVKPFFIPPVVSVVMMMVVVMVVMVIMMMVVVIVMVVIEREDEINIITDTNKLYTIP